GYPRGTSSAYNFGTRRLMVYPSPRNNHEPALSTMTSAAQHGRPITEPAPLS
ncbi:unnamed protein product, partial [Amoebophrya sp. A25]